MEMEYGIQMFGCMEIFRQDPEQFFRRVAAMGYTEVEPCIAFGPFPGKPPFLLTPEELAESGSLLRDNGLVVKSCHAFGDLEADYPVLEQVVTQYGIHRIVINLPGEDLQAGYRPFVEKAKALAAKLKATGAALWLHNGAAEVRAKLPGRGGISVLEAILENCGGLVGAQVDVGWVLYGGEDPMDYLHRLSSHVKCIHYKDMKHGFESLPPTTTGIYLGGGCLAVEPIFRYAIQNNLPQLIDQDASDGDIMNDLAKSIALLKSLE